MSYELTIRAIAEQQISDAYFWYEETLAGLGDEFLLSIDASLNYISRNPFHSQKKHKEIRVGFTDRFPYGIYFFVEDKEIIVFAVFHLSRDPKRWKI